MEFYLCGSLPMQSYNTSLQTFSAKVYPFEVNKLFTRSKSIEKKDWDNLHSQFKNNIVQKYLITKIEQSNLKVNKQRNWKKE